MALTTLHKRAWLVLRAKIDEETADDVMLSKLRGHFEQGFRYDKKGALRVWKPEDNIDGIFKRARDQVCIHTAVVEMTADRAPQTLDLLQFYSKISPVSPSPTYIIPADAVVPSSPDGLFDFETIITEKQKLNLAAKFRGDAHTYYFDAKANMVPISRRLMYLRCAGAATAALAIIVAAGR